MTNRENKTVPFSLFISGIKQSLNQLNPESFRHVSSDLSSNRMDQIIGFSFNHEENVVQKWRKLIFQGIFTSFLVFITIPYLMSSRVVLQHEMWANFIVYSLCYFSIFVIVFVRKISFNIKSIIGLLSFYGLGLIALISVGSAGSGKLYLLSASIIATLLFGVRVGLFTILINSTILVLLGFYILNGTIVWIPENAFAFKSYTTTSATFLFLNATLTISLAVLVRVLENNLKASQQAALKLKTANDALIQNQKQREKLERQLIQAQKMESIGRLAGGVAHDYNNISSIIMGYCELAIEEVNTGDPLYGKLTEIHKAVKRSTDITRQLLAFARKQTISPKVVDINDIIDSMLNMLRRLIGEDIDLSWHPGENIQPIKIDPTQVDQILANLCVNARDAIKDVGKIDIETKNVSFDEAYCADHVGFIPGDYVMMAISDDGSGMSSDIMEKIFEPFFTTKSAGKGTGLGLATVFGIVKQNMGFINVYSEPENGTTFTLYLPVHVGPVKPSPLKSDSDIPTSRGESIILVEDDLSILRLCQNMLHDLGYHVLSVQSPGEAVQLIKKHPEKIQLLVTDVVMPEMNGRELSVKLEAYAPHLKTLFMSGYTANIIAHRGVLDDGVNFISKPFSKKDLAIKIRKALDRGNDCP